MRYSLIVLALLAQQQFRAIQAQRTAWDILFKELNRPLRLLGVEAFGRNGELPTVLRRIKLEGRTQKISPRHQRNFCDTTKARSAERPTTVHRLRPGDIDVIGAMGDSLTAGNGVLAAELLQVTVENRGAAWSIGGVGNWRQYLTLPNILKEFNPNLYGYSLRDGLASERTSKFNPAELGAMSRDIPYMAKVLHKRMQRDPRVNMTTDWKLITLLIGNNDFCLDLCALPDPAEAIKLHERNMLWTYRYLRDNIPRLLVNVVLPPNLMFIRTLVGMPDFCTVSLPFECPCLVGRHRTAAEIKLYNRTMQNWLQKDIEIANREEFNTQTFTINVHSFTDVGKFFKTKSGKTDFRYLAPDCFHLSQAGQASAANALWNNMFEAPNEKSVMQPIIMQVFRCPTKERPYFVTRDNIKADFVP